jgi:hypothetical protein
MLKTESQSCEQGIIAFRPGEAGLDAEIDVEVFVTGTMNPARAKTAGVSLPMSVLRSAPTLATNFSHLASSTSEASETCQTSLSSSAVDSFLP